MSAAASGQPPMYLLQIMIFQLNVYISSMFLSCEQIYGSWALQWNFNFRKRIRGSIATARVQKYWSPRSGKDSRQKIWQGSSVKRWIPQTSLTVEIERLLAHPFRIVNVVFGWTSSGKSVLIRFILKTSHLFGLITEMQSWRIFEMIACNLWSLTAREIKTNISSQSILDHVSMARVTHSHSVFLICIIYVILQFFRRGTMTYLKILDRLERLKTLRALHSTPRCSYCYFFASWITALGF
jgi:hypothetical protein